MQTNLLKYTVPDLDAFGDLQLAYAEDMECGHWIWWFVSCYVEDLLEDFEYYFTEIDDNRIHTWCEFDYGEECLESWLF